MKTLTFLALFFAVGLGFVGCSDRAKNPNLDRESLKIIGSPDSVTAWRTEGLAKKIKPESANDLEAFYRKYGKGLIVPPDLSRKFSELLTSASIENGLRSKCIYNPGFVVTFSRGDKSVDVFFCFECGGLVMRKAGEQKMADIGTLMNKPGQELFQMFEQLFPNSELTTKPEPVEDPPSVPKK